MRRPAYRHVAELQVRYNAIRVEIGRRLREFSSVPPDEYFYELIYCLLTPQSSAVNAAKAVDALRGTDINAGTAPAAEVLARREHYIRFHNTKAKHILELGLRYEEVRAVLSNGATPAQLRIWLVKNVKGLGWKEASHFLRNIGHRNLAILDRHILKNLKKHGVLRSLPKTLTPKRYLSIEQRFHRFADTIGISMDELDLLFWSSETGQILK